MYVCMHACMYVCMYVCVSIYMNIYSSKFFHWLRKEAWAKGHGVGPRLSAAWRRVKPVAESGMLLRSFK